MTNPAGGAAVHTGLGRRGGTGRVEPIVSGSIYVGLGITAAVSGSHARN
jgi:hypothetical protein